MEYIGSCLKTGGGGGGGKRAKRTYSQCHVIYQSRGGEGGQDRCKV